MRVWLPDPSYWSGPDSPATPALTRYSTLCGIDKSHRADTPREARIEP
jgi:hypothetical protein